MIAQEKLLHPEPPKKGIIKADITKLLPLYKKTKETENLLIDDFIQRVETILQGFSVEEDLILGYFFHTLLDSPIEQRWVLNNVQYSNQDGKF